MTLTKEWLQRFGWPTSLSFGHPLAIAHRGACDHAPENTLSAFRLAADLASELWELDARLTVDGICIVVHDDNLTRVAGRGIKVSEATFVEISSLHLDDDQHIPSLAEVIALAKETGCGLYIEIKSEGAGLAAWRLLQEAGLKFACLASFNIEWIAELRSAGCDYPLAVLVPISSDPVVYIGDLQVDIVHLCWRDASDSPHELLTDDLVKQLLDRDWQIVIWHEDRAKVLNALWKLPIMGICSNRPELLKPYRPGQEHPIEIVCHRGANFMAPENTLEGARICIDQRFQYVEIDVRTTSDGELVVIHDATLERTTDGDGNVAKTTLAEIKQLDAGGWFRAGSKGYRLPTLVQVLELCRGRAGLYVEIKQADPDAVLEVVNAHEMLADCFFWSASTEVMQRLREISPEIRLMATRWMYPSIADAISAYGAQIIEFSVELDDLNEIEQCNALGIKSMIFSKRHDWDNLADCLAHKPNMVNLDRPDRFKLLASYPDVHNHFQTTKAGRAHG